jgi:cation/acetate symporter
MSELALGVFAVMLAATLAITWYAARRTRTADFWAAGSGISGTRNGFAIAGDYMSAMLIRAETGIGAEHALVH